MSSIDLQDWRRADIRSLSRWLAEGKCSVEDLTDLAFEALETYAKPLNAVVNFAKVRAYAEAKRIGEEGGSSSPLRGIPYGAKDLLATAGGLPTTWGAEPLRDQTFDEDATVIRLLRDAGAVLTAKLSMVELAGGGGYRQPNASLTGPTLNPWNPEHWAGGSSSGSGAAVGVGALPYAIGSETRGSILMPASFCGIVGLRPTYGLVSRHGAMALSWSMDKLGPMARTVDDCALVLEAIGVPDSADITSSGRRFRWSPEAELNRKLRIGVVSREVEDASEEVATAFESVVNKLDSIGKVEALQFPDDIPYGEAARLIIASEAASFFDEFIESGKIRELTAPESRVVPYTYGTILARDYLRALRIRSYVVRVLNDVFTRYDILISPTGPRTSSRIDEPFTTPAGRDAGSVLNVATNLAGYPEISIPIGLDRAGLPIGMQIAAPAFQENMLLTAAMRIERIVGFDATPPDQT